MEGPQILQSNLIMTALKKCLINLCRVVLRDDYNGLTSDIFQTILLNVQPPIHYLSNAMYGCPIKLGANVAINGFCPIISENL